MPNLIQSFHGTDRFYSKFSSSLFKNGEDVCYINPEGRGGNGNQISARKLRYTASGRVSATTEQVYFPHDFFSDMSVFATPDLGWRMAAGGKVLLHLARNPGSTHRGIRVAGLDSHISDMTRYLHDTGAVDLSGETSPVKMAHMVMCPSYVTVQEGIAAARAGRLAGFAVSADVAVMPAANNTFTIWYRRKAVGTIDADGRIHTQMKVVADLARQETN